MIENPDHVFARLSELSHLHLQSGRLAQYSCDLKCMAKVLDMEAKYVDEAKLQMVAFYVDLSGVGNAPFIDGGK